MKFLDLGNLALSMAVIKLYLLCDILFADT